MTSPPASADLPDRLLLLLRRLVARLVDGLLLTIPLLAVSFGASLLTMFVASVAFGASGGGVEGLFAGSVVTVVAGVLVMLLCAAVFIAVPVMYLVWAGRRSGPAAGRTLGHQLMDLRCEPSSGGPTTARVLLRHELAFYLTYLIAEVLALSAGVALDLPALTSLSLIVLLIAVTWMGLTTGRLPHDRISRTTMLHRPRVADAAAMPVTSPGLSRP